MTERLGIQERFLTFGGGTRTEGQIQNLDATSCIVVSVDRIMFSMSLPSVLSSPIRRHGHVMTLARFVGYSTLGALSTSILPSTSCESSGDKNNNGLFDALLPKDTNGKVSWDKAPQQVTDSLFWDKVAKAAGQKVWGLTLFGSFEPNKYSDLNYFLDSLVSFYSYKVR